MLIILSTAAVRLSLGHPGSGRCITAIDYLLLDHRYGHRAQLHENENENEEGGGRRIEVESRSHLKNPPHVELTSTCKVEISNVVDFGDQQLPSIHNRMILDMTMIADI